AAMWLSVGPRARELYDLPPLLGFFRDALSIFGRREGEHRASKVGEARLHLGGACGRSRPWVSEIAPMVRLMPRPDYKRSRVRREPRAIGSATDKLPSKHPRQYRDGVRHQRCGLRRVGNGLAGWRELVPSSAAILADRVRIYLKLF